MEEWFKARGIPLKYVSLVLLVVQTTSLVTTIRLSLTSPGPRYLASTAVFWMELFKLVAALAVILCSKALHPAAFVASLRNDVFSSAADLARLAVPSLLYLVQNNLLYLAIANLDAPTYQVVYNAKILTTGLFAVLLLSKRLSPIQWGSLVLLMIGVSLAQYSPDEPAKAVVGSRLLGLSAVAVACVTSGFSGVYFEKMLKSGSASLWVRNVQMSLTSVPLALLSVWWVDGAAVARDGFNYGYTPVVWQIVVNQAVGGLLVAVVVRYADNLLKAFAAAISIISSSLIAAMFFDFSITVFFVMGAVCVLVATYVYSQPEAANPFVPEAFREPEKKPPLPI